MPSRLVNNAESSQTDTFHEILRNKHHPVNTLRPRQHGCHFPDGTFKYIFLNGNIWIWMKISLKSVSKGSINNIPTLDEIMAWHQPGDKPLSEPMMDNLPTHICVTQPQWANNSASSLQTLTLMEYWKVLHILYQPFTSLLEHHFADNIFRYIFMNVKFCILIKTSPKFVLKVPIDKKLSLVHIMAWSWTGGKPLSEPVLTWFTDAYMQH